MSDLDVGVRVAASDDVDEVGRILTAGFLHDPVMMWVFGGNDDVRTAKLAPFFQFLAREKKVPSGATFVTAGSCACWTPPPGVETWDDDGLVRFGSMLTEYCEPSDRGRLLTLGEAMDAVRPAEPHWYLSMIATLPSLQGQGVGGALLRHSLDIVDAAGAPAYLESSNPRNVSLYKRHGFVAVGDIPLPDGPSLTPMWRDPAS